jgi:hypothetical protein
LVWGRVVGQVTPGGQLRSTEVSGGVPCSGEIPMRVLAYGFRGVCVAELPELFQLKCLSPALEARPH